MKSGNALMRANAYRRVAEAQLEAGDVAGAKATADAITDTDL